MKYLLQTGMGGVVERSMRTGEEIARIYNLHLTFGGMYDRFRVYDVSGGSLKRVDVYDIPEVLDLMDAEMADDSEDSI